jgi:hypothetical protein
MRQWSNALMCVLASAMAMPTAAIAQSGDEVGVVAEYRPVTGRFVLLRGPRDSVAVKLGTVVHADDAVVLPAGASIMVQRPRTEPLRLSGPGRQVVPASPRMGVLASFFRKLPNLFDDSYRQSRMAAGRGQTQCPGAGTPAAAIEFPMMTPGARIVAGPRDLPLAWRGGCPPYSVHLLAGADTLAHRTAIAAPQVRLDGLTLRPGPLHLVIGDAAGQRFVGTLEVMATLPTSPAELVADTSAFGTVARAAWLAELDAGRWQFDAFERLRPLIRAGDELASALGDAILWGRAADVSDRRPQ